MRRTHLIVTTLTTSLFALASVKAATDSVPPVKIVGGTLVGTNGMTLYTFDKDAPGKSTCNGPCAENWPPLKAAATDQGEGNYGIVTRDDGSKQWAYKGKPLYYWVKDAKPGDTTGDGVKDVWHTARP